jgi:hypothetical protein
MSNHKADGSPRHVSCLNCKAPLSGTFCSQCGQRNTDHVLSLRELFHELIEVLIHADSKLWKTLRLMLIKPGEVSLEFVRGRRQSYTPPLRTYLVVSLLFFLTVELTSGLNSNVPKDQAPVAPIVLDAKPGMPSADPCSVENLRVDTPGLRWLNPRLGVVCNRIMADSGKHFVDSVIRNIPKAMFVFLPLISLMAALLYIRSRRHYVEHLVFFIHHHTFAFLLLTLLALAGELFGSVGLVAFGLLIYLPVYLYLGMRRFYGQGHAATAIKFVVLTGAYIFCMLLTGAIAVVGTALTL